VSLARSIASASVLKVCIDATGPKISSFSILASSDTLVRTVAG